MPTPDRRGRSRPPSFVGRGESPIHLRSRSSTSDSLRSGSSPNSGPRTSVFFNGPNTSNTSNTSSTSATVTNPALPTNPLNSNRKLSPQTVMTGSLKKRAAPLPPPDRDAGHTRNASDYGVSFPAQRMKLAAAAGAAGAANQSRKSLTADYASSEAKQIRSFHQSAAHLRKYSIQFRLFSNSINYYNHYNSITINGFSFNQLINKLNEFQFFFRIFGIF